MGELSNWSGDLNDYLNARKSWLESSGRSQKRVRIYIFQGYETMGNTTNPNETFRKQKYVVKNDSIWIAEVKVYDTVKQGYFTTGDLNICSETKLRGFSPAYLLPSGVRVDEYSGDIVEWNGKLWEVADQLAPITWGVLTDQVFFNCIIRRTNRSGIGTEVGA
jgi:hypothetical protein